MVAPIDSPPTQKHTPNMDATPPPAPPPAPVPAAPAAATEADGKTIAIIAYITLIGFIVALIMHTSKKTQIGAFHLRQMLGLILTGIVLWPVNIVLMFIPILGWLCMFAIFVCMVGLWIMGLVAALNGEMKPTPVLGPMYQKWFGNAFN
jgi:uncharacterized membrane protein